MELNVELSLDEIHEAIRARVEADVSVAGMKVSRITLHYGQTARITFSKVEVAQHLSEEA